VTKGQGFLSRAEQAAVFAALSKAAGLADS